MFRRNRPARERRLCIRSARRKRRIALRWSKELQDEIIGFKGDEVVYMSVGDGTTSEGEWWEALNTACNLKLPVIFCVEDNGYAISVPVEVGTAGGDISKLVEGFPNLLIQKCDGTDPLESYETFKRAVEYCRERKGPAFVHAKVIRPYSHSLSDDERLYRPEEERQKDAEIDPIKTFAEFLMTEGIVSSEDLEKLRKEVDAEVTKAADIAIETPQPAPETALRNVFSPDVDPTSADFDTEDGAELSGNAGTMVDLINRCLHEEMERDPRIVIFGEDVADVSREEYLEKVKGKGGVFKVTANLQRNFGSARVFNSPLAEANIVGRAVGMAIRNLKPVVEIQFFDYIFPAFHQIRNEVAVTRWRSDGDTKCPMVMRVPVGGYLKGGAVYHSQSGTTLFSHTPGLMIAYPSNALDANGLLRTSIRCDDPVLFLEHKHLYRQVYNKSQYPSSEFMIPFGKAKTVREGTDVTIVTYGAFVQRSLMKPPNEWKKKACRSKSLISERSSHTIGNASPNRSRKRRASSSRTKIRFPTATAQRSPRGFPTNCLNTWTHPSAVSARPIHSSPTLRRSKISSCRKSRMSKKPCRN